MGLLAIAWVIVIRRESARDKQVLNLCRCKNDGAYVVRRAEKGLIII